MPSLRIALLCIDPWEEKGSFQPFNYAVRKVQAALVARGFEAVLIESRSTDVSEFESRVLAERPDVVGASAYVWSFPTFVELARRLRRASPGLRFVLGGPSARQAMLSLPPHRDAIAAIDALVEGEGEQVFVAVAELLDRDRGASLEGVPGITTPTADGGFRSVPAPLPELDALASPYALGLVPAGVSAHLETFRGCPLACSFCQWGEGTTSRTRSAERLAEELLAFRALGARDAILVDAALNLNAKAFRALAEAERQTRVLARDVQLSFECYPSHLHDEHLAFLADIQVNSIGLGLQSYDPEVLRRLDRRFDAARFERVARELTQLRAQVTIEIILGLPGDHPESFRRTLDRARSLGCDVRVFHCLVLPDALLTRAPPWAEMVFDPVTLRMESCAGWSREALSAVASELSREAKGAEGWDQGSFWFFPRDEQRGRSGPALLELPPPAPYEVSPREVEAARFVSEANLALSGASRGTWRVTGGERGSTGFWLELDAAGEPVVIDVVAAAPGAPSFVTVDDVALSYRPGARALSRATLAALRTLAPTFAALHDRSAPPHRRVLPLVAP